MSSVIVTPVRDRRDLREFVRLPFRIYADDPNWVAPLGADMRQQLDPARNPFFAHARARHFLARRDGDVVGRVSAHVDERYNEFHARGPDPDATGFWGFFECEDDPEAALALFDAAAGWLAGEGRTTMLGPASFTLNDECGLLVDGFDSPPMILMTYNPPYYEQLVGKAGFEKAHDLWAYRLDASVEAPETVRAFAHSAELEGFTFRTLDMRRFEREMEGFLDVYNHAWERNWGFVPMTEQEIRVHARRLKPVIDPNLVIVAELDGETAAVGLTVPNVNEVLVTLRGRLGPVGAARLLWTARRRAWRSCRVVALGVKKEYRRTGVGAHLYVDTLEAARRGGYGWGEMSWILESNDAMNSGIRTMGGTVYKTYRMYALPTS